MAFVPFYIFILVILIIIDYTAGILIEKAAEPKRKYTLVFSLLSNILILGFFKYYNFFVQNTETVLGFITTAHMLPYLSIVLPIGLSFHTFQSMSYTIEVYRGNYKAERNFAVYSLYVLFYPQMVAGPIERPEGLLRQLQVSHRFDYDNVVTGLRLILWGMIKKVVIADRLAIIVDKVYDNPDLNNGWSLLLATYFFAIQIYCDFSGYSDIAIGAAKTMGIDLRNNFNAPYFARSISDFWQRWHISLSTWFRDYVFLPVAYYFTRKIKNVQASGYRKEIMSYSASIIVTMFVAGLWHGASWNFVIWGCLFGIFLVIGRATQKWRKKIVTILGLHRYPKIYHVLQLAITFHLVCFSWIFFRANSFQDTSIILMKIGSAFSSPFLISGFSSQSTLVLSLFSVALLIVMELLAGRTSVSEWLRAKRVVSRWSLYLAFVIMILLIGVFDGGQFIYFQF